MGAAAFASAPLPPGYVHAPYWPSYGDYKSWVAVVTPTSPDVIFINYRGENCTGFSFNLTNVQTKCFGATLPNGKKYSWNGVANSTNIWFNNYGNEECSGSGGFTRCYQSMKCMNCPPSDPLNCKNPPAPCVQG